MNYQIHESINEKRCERPSCSRWSLITAWTVYISSFIQLDRDLTRVFLLHVFFLFPTFARYVALPLLPVVLLTFDQSHQGAFNKRFQQSHGFLLQTDKTSNATYSTSEKKEREEDDTHPVQNDTSVQTERPIYI